MRDFPLLEILATRDGWTCRMAVPADHALFEGHFPGRPILPGIAHVALATAALAAAIGRPVSVRALPVLRLRRLVTPGEEIELSLEHPRAGGSVRFEIRTGGESASRGELVVEPGG